MTLTVSPRELPELRHSLDIHPEMPGFVFDMHRTAIREMGEDNPITSGPSDLFVSVVGYALRAGTLHYVDQAFSALVNAAAPSMPNAPLAEHDLPDPYGVMLFSEPLPDPRYNGAPVRYMAVWLPYQIESGGGGMMTVWFANGADTAQQAGWDPQVLATYPAYAPALVTCSDFGTVFRDEELAADAPREAALIRYLLATWNLQRQRLTTTRIVRPDRASGRRLDRSGDLTDRAVRVINLRIPDPSEGDRPSDREFRHQWIVRGHWRQQWYPSIDDHRPVWIAPHIKGPEGAPLLGGEKVYAWNR